MASPRTHRFVAFWLSVLGHAVIVVALTFSVSLSTPMQPPGGVVVPVETVMVDQAALDARDARIEAERQTALRQQQEEEQRIRNAERIRQEQAAEIERQKIQIEAERRAEAERLARLEEERIEREAEDARLAAAEREEQLARERAEAERRRREEELERQRDRVAAEIAAAAAAEQQAREAADSGERARWAAMISNKLQQHWQRPLNASSGLVCILVVEQLITGEVRSVSVSECNVSDQTIIRSLENAVLAASPLPTRPPGVEFERIVRIRFEPTD